MLLKLGQRRARSEELVDLLLACHERIRSFVALARAAAEREDCSEQEVIEACQDVERYFREALPLHVQDEEQSVVPRLGGHSAAVDRALGLMQLQHVDHEAKLRALLEACAALREHPRDPGCRARLARAATVLQQDFHEHLELEEREVFPALSALSPAAQQEVLAELRARRKHP